MLPLAEGIDLFASTRTNLIQAAHIEDDLPRQVEQEQASLLKSENGRCNKDTVVGLGKRCHGQYAWSEGQMKKERRLFSGEAAAGFGLSFGKSDCLGKASGRGRERGSRVPAAWCRPVGCWIAGFGQSSAWNAQIKRVRRPCRQQHLPRTTSKNRKVRDHQLQSWRPRRERKISHCWPILNKNAE